VEQGREAGQMAYGAASPKQHKDILGMKMLVKIHVLEP
jgi:hypothetical protein